MGKTFADAKLALGQWLGMNAVRLPDEVRGDILNMARRELSRLYDLAFNEVEDSFTTEAGERAYDLPAGWSRPYQLWYTHPEHGGVVTLDLLSREAFDRRFPDETTTGKPTAYTVWGGQLLLGQTPDRALTIHRTYYRILPDLAGTQTDDLMDQAWEVVHFKALADVSRYGIEDARIPMWQARARDLEDQLVIEHSRARSAGRRPVSQEPG